MNICIGLVCLLVLDRRKHNDGGSSSASALLGEGVFVSRENFRMVEREKKVGKDKGRGILTAGSVSSGCVVAEHQQKQK